MQCQGVTKNGTQCSRIVTDSNYCWQHLDQNVKISDLEIKDLQNIVSEYIDPKTYRELSINDPEQYSIDQYELLLVQQEMRKLNDQLLALNQKIEKEHKGDIKPFDDLLYSVEVQIVIINGIRSILRAMESFGLINDISRFGNPFIKDTKAGRWVFSNKILLYKVSEKNAYINPVKWIEVDLILYQGDKSFKYRKSGTRESKTLSNSSPLWKLLYDTINKIFDQKDIIENLLYQKIS